MSRPTLEDLLPLREPIPTPSAPAGIESIKIISGVTERTDGDMGLELTGRMVLSPQLQMKPRPMFFFSSAPPRWWVWRSVGAVKDWDGGDLRNVPDWPGISDGDPVTRGHVKALIDGGWLHG